MLFDIYFLAIFFGPPLIILLLIIGAAGAVKDAVRGAKPKEPPMTPEEAMALDAKARRIYAEFATMRAKNAHQI